MNKLHDRHTYRARRSNYIPVVIGMIAGFIAQLFILQMIFDWHIERISNQYDLYVMEKMKTICSDRYDEVYVTIENNTLIAECRFVREEK